MRFDVFVGVETPEVLQWINPCLICNIVNVNVK